MKPRRKIRWRRVKCPVCGDLITNNALGREAHIRHCKGNKARCARCGWPIPVVACPHPSCNGMGLEAPRDE